MLDLTTGQYLSRKIFMEGGAPPHINYYVISVLKRHFTEERIISFHFPDPWPPRSPDCSPCDLWVWGILKHLESRVNPRTVPLLKDSNTLLISPNINSLTSIASKNNNVFTQFLVIS